MNNLVWEPLVSNRCDFFKAKVPGGWLIMLENDVQHERNGQLMGGHEWRHALVFVPEVKEDYNG